MLCVFLVHFEYVCMYVCLVYCVRVCVCVSQTVWCLFLLGLKQFQQYLIYITVARYPNYILGCHNQYEPIFHKWPVISPVDTEMEDSYLTQRTYCKTGFFIWDTAIFISIHSVSWKFKIHEIIYKEAYLWECIIQYHKLISNIQRPVFSVSSYLCFFNQFFTLFPNHLVS